MTYQVSDNFKRKYIIFNSYSLAFLFIYAGVYKIVDVGLFESQMYLSPLLPYYLVPYFAILVPLFEIFLALGLIFSDKHKLLLFQVAFGLMFFFSIYLIMLYALYDKPPCACGGILNNIDYPNHITFNIFFSFTAFFGIKFYEKEQS